MLPGESVCAAIPEPITTVASNPEPKSSANSRRASGGALVMPRGAACPRTRRQTGRADLGRDRLGVVSDPLDGDVYTVRGRCEEGEGATRVAVLGLADRAAIDEQHPAVLPDPRLVRVPEHEHRVRLRRGEALVQARGLVLEQILVDLPRRAVDQVDLGLPTGKCRSKGKPCMNFLDARLVF